MSTLDLRGNNVELRFTRGDWVQVSLDYGTNVAAYVGWEAAIATTVGGSAVATFTNGTAQASAGVVTLTLGTAVTSALTAGDYVWWVEHTPTASQPRTIISGRCTVAAQGARGAGSTNLEVTVDTGTVTVSVAPGGDVAAHIADTTDAHDASAISVTPAGNLAASDVQTALTELQTDVDTRAIGSVIDGASGSRPSVLGGHAGNAIASDIIAGVITGGGTDFRENVIGGQYDNVNTPTTNLPTVLGTVANYSSIEGGYDNVANGLMSVIHGAHNRTHQDSTHPTIGGGSVNTISAGDYGTIAGGTDNNLSGDQAAIVGGSGNTASGDYSVVGGQNNTATGSGAIALGGGSSTASGASAATLGLACVAEGNYSRAFGERAYARSYGQEAMANGRFVTDGDAQTSVVFYRRQTTNATVTTAGLAGGNTAHNILESSTVAFRMLVTAREAATADSKAWQILGLMKRAPGGSSALVGSATITEIAADAGAAAWTVAIAGSSAGGLLLRVTGEADHTINWAARVELTELVTA
jgi:hypothetical protein